MSSSDSSDDENLELFKEATDPQFINDSMFKNMGKTKFSKEERNKVVEQSLRTARGSSNDGFDTLNVTPQFQNYIAKKLSNILDKQIEESVGPQDNVKKPKKSKKKDGIKLLSNSVGAVTVEDETHVLRFKKIKTNSCKVLRKKEEDVIIDFRHIAVNPEDIINGKEIKHWSQWNRSKVFKYKRLNNGKLEYLEPEFK